MFEIDELDKQILRILQADAAVTHRQIAQTLRRSITTIHDRISRLKQEGIILRSVAILDRKKVGKGLLTFSHVLLNQHTIEVLEQFEKAVKQFPEVLECFQMTGSFDFLLRVSTRDMEEYHEFPATNWPSYPISLLLTAILLYLKPRALRLILFKEGRL
ncbi:Lrp/AsnC family transcriptional regulator [Niabella sp. W65]|nr:Lrp/AsnC family transcriptional regulator [Niabella sp. W65]MCH7364579.1 Lrp/AsnC family transcriptional regulator [Niabella sp. W65]